MVPASHVWRRLCVCAIAGLLAACETAHTRTSSSSDLTGRYGAETGLLYGDNRIGLVNGKRQSVMMTLAPHQGSYDVTWTNETSDLAQGIAIRSGNILAVARGKAPRDFWNDYENLGIAVYEEKGAELHGALVFQGDPRRRIETQVLRWSDGSKDRLDIVSDSSRVDPQSGQVKITRNGRAYLFAWFEPRLTFSGTAVKVGNTFVVALIFDQPAGGSGLLSGRRSIGGARRLECEQVAHSGGHEPDYTYAPSR